MGAEYCVESEGLIFIGEIVGFKFELLNPTLIMN